MWVVYEHRSVDKQLRSLPVDVLKRYEKWKDIVFISGPKGLKIIKGFRDEALRGKWKGQRSSLKIRKGWMPILFTVTSLETTRSGIRTE